MTTPPSLAARIREQGPAISAAVTRRMYAEDPFWSERFGQRGERHAGEDADYHVRYLAEALEAGEPTYLAEYARWLRSVLATRGMCSRHLETNLRYLADAFEASGIADADGAAAYLRQAAAGLRYKGPGGAMMEAADALAHEAAAHYRRSGGSSAVNPASEELAHDLLHLLSYVADGVAFGRSDLLAAHARWLEGFHLRRGRPRSYGDQLLAAVEAALLAHGDADAVAGCDLLRRAAAERAAAPDPFGATQ